jgi:hypothetical protein
VKLLGAICGAAFGIICTWGMAGIWAPSLPSAAQHLGLSIVTVTAAAVGALSGGAIAGRAGRQRAHLALFSGLAAGTAGGILGCVLGLVILISYLSSYAGWPADRGDQILMLLAFPAFGALGFLLGAGVAGLLGFLAGSVLRLAAPPE